MVNVKLAFCRCSAKWAPDRQRERERERECVSTCGIDKYFLPLPETEPWAHSLYNVSVPTRQHFLRSHVAIRNTIHISYAD
jgi:hypothetical protein